MFAASIATNASAGILLSPNARWQSLSFVPEDEEDTPNYYAYGAGATVGLSIEQTVDIAAWGLYAPGNRHAASTENPDVDFHAFGGEIAVRIVQSVYLAARGGQYYYHLRKKIFDEEVPGTWAGLGGGGSMGAIFAVSKIHFWQVSIDFAHAVLQAQDATAKDFARDPDDEDVIKDRQIDTFSLTLAYIFNSKSILGGSIFGSFFDSLL